MSKFKRYERYKDSGVEWIGEIPENWEGKSLRHVIKFIRNGTTATQIDESEYVVTRIETISSGKIDLDKVGYVDYFKDIQKYKLDKGDILFSHINSLAMVGNCAIYDFDINLYNGMNLLQIRPSDDVCKKWLLYFLKSYYFNQSVKAIAKHAINQVSVPVNRLKEVRIFEPSIDEQYSIANFLDQKTAEIDGLIADKEKLIELLQEKRQAVITEAVTKGLNPNVRMKDSGIEWIGEIPEHWEVASFTKYISSIVDYRGKTPEK